MKTMYYLPFTLGILLISCKNAPNTITCKAKVLSVGALNIEKNVSRIIEKTTYIFESYASYTLQIQDTSGEHSIFLYAGDTHGNTQINTFIETYNTLSTKKVTTLEMIYSKQPNGYWPLQLENTEQNIIWKSPYIKK